MHVESLDLTDKEAIQEWLSVHPQIDLCLHLAAMSSPGVCQQEPDRAYACNNPIHWFRALSSRGIPIVALSTDQVYDGTIQDPTYKETDATNPVNVYGITKKAMEDFLIEHCTGTPCIILRSSIVLGPLAPFGEAHSTFLHFCKSRKDQETDFYTDEYRTVVSIDNVVDVLVYFCQRGITSSGVYNMGGSDRVSRYDMALAVFKRFGYDTQYVIPKEKAAGSGESIGCLNGQLQVREADWIPDARPRLHYQRYVPHELAVMLNKLHKVYKQDSP